MQHSTYVFYGVLLLVNILNGRIYLEVTVLWTSNTWILRKTRTSEGSGLRDKRDYGEKNGLLYRNTHVAMSVGDTIER